MILDHGVTSDNIIGDHEDNYLAPHNVTGHPLLLIPWVRSIQGHSHSTVSFDDLCNEPYYPQMSNTMIVHLTNQSGFNGIRLAGHCALSNRCVLSL